jgi:hypothetical protein
MAAQDLVPYPHMDFIPMSGFSLGTKWDKISENDYKIAPKGPMWH